MNKKYVIIIVLVSFIILLGVISSFLLTNNNINQINMSSDKNTSNIINNETINDNSSNNIKLDKKNNENKISKRTIKKDGNSGIMSKKQVIRIVRSFYSDDGEYKIISVNLVKNSTGNYFWIVKIREIPYGDNSFFIDAKTGDSVNPLMVGLGKFATNEVAHN
jgi:hypothetical protein